VEDTTYRRFAGNMSAKREEKKVKIPTFKGDRKMYNTWKERFGQWELANDYIHVTWDGDKTDVLITPIENLRQKKKVTAADGTVSEVVTDAKDKKLYDDNHNMTNKLMECLSDELVDIAGPKGGPKRSAFRIKAWLDAQYGYVRAEDSLQELQLKLKELNPSDYEEAMGFLSKMDEINYRMETLEERYKMDDLQMILKVLDKLPDVSDKKPQEKWGQFPSKIRRE
jgi:hypothetical protein